jgi:hypothetical protein
VMIQTSRKRMKHVQTCAERYKSVDKVHDSGRTVVQRKSIVHTKMLNEG